MSKSNSGCFAVPHMIYDETQAFNKNTKALLCVLFALQDKYNLPRYDSPRQWVNVSNKELCRMVGFNPGTLRKCRSFLVENDLVEFRRGYPGRNSSYRLLMDY